jgi:hypothetical protein
MSRRSAATGASAAGAVARRRSAAAAPSDERRRRIPTASREPAWIARGRPERSGTEGGEAATGFWAWARWERWTGNDGGRRACGAQEGGAWRG